MLITDCVTRFMQDYYFKDNQTARLIIKALKLFVILIKTQFSITVKIIETNNKIVTVKLGVACQAES